MNAGTAQFIHLGSPNQEATSINVTNEIANATSPANATPMVIMRMNFGSSGLIRDDRARVTEIVASRRVLWCSPAVSVIALA